ncbi:MAG: 12-oxophytodienoate reductase [Akkermansia sp.]|nr:12-oxophytodienoate reductase [Akkermansia sp.]
MKTTALSLRDVDFLFTPFVHRKLRLSTRLVMAPVQRFLAQDGVPTEEMMQYYYRRAVNAMGLIVTEPVAVPEPAAAADAGMAVFYGGPALRAWKKICRMVHTTPCRIAPLLSHAGMLSQRQGVVLPIGPGGGVGLPGVQPGEMMNHTRIAEVAAAFGRGAAAAKILGFDAVVINGADAHLIEQFLRAETNQRCDEYGGDICGRARFACAVVHAVRKAVGRQFPILFRFAQYSALYGRSALVFSSDELSRLLGMLCDAGVDIFCCADTQASLPAFGGSMLNLAGWTRLLTGRPAITEGAVGLPGVQIQALAQRLRASEFDLVSVGRALLADCAWGTKVRLSREDEIIPFSRRSWLHLY